MRIASAPWRSGASLFATHDFMPTKRHLGATTCLHHEIRFIYPSILMLDIALVENRNPLGSKPRQNRIGRGFKPLLPLFKAQMVQLHVVWQRRDDMVIGQTIRPREPLQCIAANHFSRGRVVASACQNFDCCCRERERVHGRRLQSVGSQQKSHTRTAAPSGEFCNGRAMQRRTSYLAEARHRRHFERKHQTACDAAGISGNSHVVQRSATQHYLSVETPGAGETCGVEVGQIRGFLADFSPNSRRLARGAVLRQQVQRISIEVRRCRPPGVWSLTSAAMILLSQACHRLPRYFLLVYRHHLIRTTAIRCPFTVLSFRRDFDANYKRTTS